MGAHCIGALHDKWWTGGNLHFYVGIFLCFYLPEWAAQALTLSGLYLELVLAPFKLERGVVAALTVSLDAVMPFMLTKGAATCRGTLLVGSPRANVVVGGSLLSLLFLGLVFGGMW